jgi:hypothetical protein
MIKDVQAQKCMGFLEVVRTMIDNAEVEIASATRAEFDGLLLARASAQIEIAAKNLSWTAEEISSIAKNRITEIASASAANGPVA